MDFVSPRSHVVFKVSLYLGEPLLAPKKYLSALSRVSHMKQRYTLIIGIVQAFTGTRAEVKAQYGKTNTVR